MKLSEHIKNCQEILEKYGDLETVYSSDDEGNYFGIVNFTPSVGFFNSDGFNSLEVVEKYAEQDPEDYGEFVGKTPNAVCIN